MSNFIDYTYNPSPYEPPSVTRFTLAFTNDDLVSDILTVDHNLNQKYVQSTIYDNADTETTPTEIVLVNSNRLHVDLSGMTPITGTWNIVIM